jgi:YfiR/HmsC-like
MDLGLQVRRYVSFGTAAIAGMILTNVLTPSYALDSYSEDAVKAAYLYRFGGYVNWPEDVPANAVFTIDVIGSPGVAMELRRLLAGHSINGHPGEVHEISSVRDLGQANMLYASQGHAELLRNLAPAPNSRAMLLVTDEEDGLKFGSALNFLTIDHNVRFEVSLTTAKRWGLKISSDLLGVAIRVQGSPRI